MVLVFVAKTLVIFRMFNFQIVKVYLPIQLALIFLLYALFE